MLFEDTKMKTYNQYQKFDKSPSKTRVGEHIPSGFSISTISSFKNIENKHDVYRGKDCIKKFCESLREHAMNTIDLKKNEVINKKAAEII